LTGFYKRQALSRKTATHRFPSSLQRDQKDPSYDNCERNGKSEIAIWKRRDKLGNLEENTQALPLKRWTRER
jgi:hypothetical protein